MSSNPQHEPTMEEILASIRKIISEDSADAPPAEAKAPQAAPRPAPQPEPDSDVLDLTEAIEETPEPAPLAPEPMPADDVVFQTIEEEPVSSVPAQAPSGEGIFSDKTRKALDDTFAGIRPAEANSHAAPATSVAPIDGHSVEAVLDRAIRETFEPVLKSWLAENSGAVIDRMKPIIREWMDENFPDLLEEAVRNEVARKARKR
ncbi:MAG TPA: DUF2497 domain-containing protein [Rhizomicrobium sp.]|nr:DUF2497 domain-containing protein [Rhizomicrobium sp.]